MGGWVGGWVGRWVGGCIQDRSEVRGGDLCVKMIVLVKMRWGSMCVNLAYVSFRSQKLLNSTHGKRSNHKEEYQRGS